MSSKASSDIPALPKPLSAYNLFYRYKRIRIIQASSGDKSSSCNKEAITLLIMCPPGLEGYYQAISSIRAIIPPDRVDAIRGSNIRIALDGQMFSKDRKSRIHRKSAQDYKMSFAEMNKIMVDSWKACDSFSKALFKELAADARRDYERRMNKIYSDKYFSLFVNKMSSNPEEIQRVNNDCLARIVTGESISPSSRTETVTGVVSARSPGLNSSWDTLPFQNKKLAAASSCIHEVEHNRALHLQPKDEMSPSSKFKSLIRPYAESIPSSSGFDASLNSLPISSEELASDKSERSHSAHPPQGSSHAQVLMSSASIHSPTLARRSSPTDSRASSLLLSDSPLPFKNGADNGRSYESRPPLEDYAQDHVVGNSTEEVSNLIDIFDETPPLPVSAKTTSSVVGENNEAASLGDFSIRSDLPEPAGTSVEDFLEMFATLEEAL